MKFVLIGLIAFALIATATASAIADDDVNVIAIARPNRVPPTSNSYIVYDNNQVLVIDVGKVFNDTVELVAKLDPLLETRRLNGFLITHGHPDHCGQAYFFKDRYPSAPIFVGSAAVQQEMVVLMDVFGNFLNRSSPGNPDGDAPQKFDYGSPQNIRVAHSASDLWQGSNVELHVSSSRLGETNHFAYIDVHQSNGEVLLFSGDLIYIDTHVYMGFGVTMMAQCDWINYLLDELYPMYERFGPNVTIHPGHGPVTAGGLKQPMNKHIEYIQYARHVYASSCSADAARGQILQKFANLNDALLFTDFTLPYRVPYDAVNLGCNCQAPSPSCTTRAPKCF